VEEHKDLLVEEVLLPSIYKRKFKLIKTFQFICCYSDKKVPLILHKRNRRYFGRSNYLAI